MTYLKSIKFDGTTPQSQMYYDAFGRMRTSVPYTIFDTKTVKGNENLIWDDAEISGTGTSSAFQINKSSYQISVSANTAGHRARQSKLRGIYQPGKSQFVFLTGLIGDAPNGITKRWGAFDNRNGLFFQDQNGLFSVGIRTNTSGSPVDKIIIRDNFNFDKLDGTGISGYNMNLNRSKIFFIDFEWLGVGQIRYGVVDKGIYYLCHIETNSNELDLNSVVYMSDPSLPIRYEIINDGTGPESSLNTICSSILSEGGQENTSITYNVSRGGTLVTLGAQDTYTPIISIRLKSNSNIGTIPDVNAFTSKVIIESIDIFSTSNINYEWKLFLNPTIGGTDNANWVNLDHTSIQYDISRNNTNLLTDGFIISGGYSSSSNQVKAIVSEVIKTYLTMGSNIDETSDEIVLGVANIDDTGGSVYGGLSLSEI
jgi:hypothetical protein